MKKLLLVLVLALSFSSGLKADVSDMSENETSVTDSSRYVPLWYCYSDYVGPYGWGHYYGYAYNQFQARNNAFLFCANDHRDSQFCVISGCYLR